jgi:hypothetical protein
VFANSTRYITLANSSVFAAKDDWEALGDASLETNAIVVTGQNSVGGLFFKTPFNIVGSEDRGFTSYFKLTHTEETSGTRVPLLSEGVVFVLAKDRQVLGIGGDSKGYHGISNSIGFEIDLISQQGDFTTSHVHDKILKNGLKLLDDNGINLITGNDYRNLHVWIEYSSLLNRVQFFVSGSPSKPSTPSHTYLDETLTSFFNEEVYLGVTSSTSNQATLRLDEVYFLSAYDKDGIKPFTQTHISDSIPPTNPSFNISKTGSIFNVSISGSTDSISLIKEYQFSYNNLTWTKFNPGSIIIDSPRTIYARAIDLAGNVSEVSQQIFFEADYLYGVVKSSEKILHFIGQNVILPINVANQTNYISSWKNSVTGETITNINQLTAPAHLIGQVSRHRFNMTYSLDYDNGILPDNLPSTFSILSNPFTLPIAVREGYAFNGWFSGEEKITVLDSNVSENLELEAQFSPLKAVIEIYDFNNNVLTLDIITHRYLRTLNSIDVPDGFNFVGYFTEPFGQGIKIDTNTYVLNGYTFKIYPHIVPTEEPLSYSQTLSLHYNIDSDDKPHLTWLYVTFIVVTISSLVYIVKRGGRHESN